MSCNKYCWLDNRPWQVCLQGKETRQISRLIPLEDWIDFKNRTREVKPLDKLIGKLRATYDFVFHKPDNVSNVGKILNETSENEATEEQALKKPISNIGIIERRKSIQLQVSKEIDENKKQVENQVTISTTKNTSSDRQEEKLEKTVEKLSNLENLDETFELENLEIFGDENSFDSFDEEFENSEKKYSSPHSKFALPYAIAQALMRWIISLYLSTSNHFSNINMGTKESA